jgi:cysteine synthase A
VLGLIGETPMVSLARISFGAAEICGKLESLNPGGSVKDRIALSMIEAAEREGLLNSGDTIVEPTSGNTGVGLAMVAAVKGYKLILTMPEDMSMERRRLFTRFGAQLVLTPAIEGMTGAVYAAQEMHDGEGYFMPQQFNNAANPDAHRRTTAREILRQTEGKIDAFVAGVGTGGTITGVGEVLRAERPTARIYAVEPALSPVLAGGEPGFHRIQGIGAGFVPDVLEKSLLDAIIKVGNDESLEMARRMAREEGILCGISSGAAVTAALRYAQGEGQNLGLIVVIIPSFGERYIQTKLFEPYRYEGSDDVTS